MPTFEEHTAFVRSQPYLAWYLLDVDGDYVGSSYLTRNREVGISIFGRYKRKGYGMEALQLILRRWPGKMLANINPKNAPSIAFFEKAGFKHIQNTYQK
jgi:RimJ/RimL family protein N-acetyltransferase